MENVTQLYWSEDKYKNGEDVPETLLDESEYIDRIVPACNPDNSCEVIQDFLGEGGIDKFSIFRSIQTECYEEIYQCQNRIEEYKKKIKAEIQDIIVHKQKLNDAFNQYIE
jgi:hypothetical protein